MGVNRWRVLSAIGIVASLRRSLGDVAAMQREVQWVTRAECGVVSQKPDPLKRQLLACPYELLAPQTLRGLTTDESATQARHLRSQPRGSAAAW